MGVDSHCGAVPCSTLLTYGDPEPAKSGGSLKLLAQYSLRTEQGV